jgi:hypothetical protein
MGLADPVVLHEHHPTLVPRTVKPVRVSQALSDPLTVDVGHHMHDRASFEGVSESV